MADFRSSALIKRLEKAGFERIRVKGSHHIFKSTNGKRVVVPHPKKDLPIGTFNAILKTAGLK